MDDGAAPRYQAKAPLTGCAMDIATLTDQEKRLVLKHFNEDTALELGMSLVTLALADNLPVVINIRTPNRTLFHAALPGSAQLNDNWARRKSNVALMFHQSSMLVTTTLQEKGGTLSAHGLPEADYASSGGSFPIRVQNVGMVAVVTVSGLPQLEDHALAVRALDNLLALQSEK
jgi:uncharacterized protein (UPF0303 family)